jgi:hypothetical protein
LVKHSSWLIQLPTFRGILNKGKVSDNPELAELDALYKQFIEDGGSTGSLGATTLRDPEEAVKALQKSLHTGNQKGIIRKGFDALDRVNSYSTGLILMWRTRLVFKFIAGVSKVV